MIKPNYVENCKHLETCCNGKRRNCAAFEEKLSEAANLIKNIVRVTWGEGWNYSLNWKTKAEKFLEEAK